MIRSYGGYSVTIADDGAILVKQGDWISKYSAAIYRGDTTKTNEYGRLRGGKMVPLPDPNRIFAGEIIYHIPTFVMNKLEKPDKELRQAIDTGTRLLSEIRALKAKRSVDQKEIDRLQKKAEGLETNARDASGVCSDTYACIAGGLIYYEFRWKAQALDKQAQEVRKKVGAVSKSLEELDQRIQENLKEQERLRALVQDAKRTLSRGL